MIPTDDGEASSLAAKWGPLAVAAKRDRRLQYLALQRHLLGSGVPDQRLPVRRAEAVQLRLAVAFADSQAWPPFYLPGDDPAAPAGRPPTVAAAQFRPQGRFAARGRWSPQPLVEVRSSPTQGVVADAPDQSGMHVLVLTRGSGNAAAPARPSAA